MVLHLGNMLSRRPREVVNFCKSLKGFHLCFGSAPFLESMLFFKLYLVYNDLMLVYYNSIIVLS